MNTELITATLTLQHGEPRSQGVHVSSIINRLAVANGSLKPEYLEDFSLLDLGRTTEAWWQGLDPQNRLRISIGLAWEQWYLPQLGNVSFHPGEMQVDGIYMTHDGESLDVIASEHGNNGHALCLHEAKTTYKSTKTVGDLSTQWMWLAQTKAYCKGLGSLTAYLHVLFLCGDYTYPIRPQLKVWRISYTQAEIDDNWEVMTTFYQHLLQQEREDLMKDTYDAK